MINIIEFDNVSKSFKNKYRVLSALNLKCFSGNTYFLFGNTCSGKSTIIKLLLKDIEPNAGIVRICGDDIFKYTKKETHLYLQQLGIIWQELFLVDHKTVYENIALPLILRGEKTRIIQQKVKALLIDAELYDVKDAFPYELTLAQKQLISVARALVNQPKILLADEPMTHLDTIKEKLVWNLINKYKHSNAVVLIATSQEYVIENFSGDIIYLEKEKVLANV